MNSVINLEKLFHRSKDRIKILGEVFTPESYVEEMLSLISKDKRNFWSDEDIYFFEPCCGHGNIVISIYKRRLDAFFKAGQREHGINTPYFAVANALNTLWAIDIDSKNVESCRTRVLATTLDFLNSKIGETANSTLFGKKKAFFSHIISAIRWHITENETLSSLSIPKKAKVNAQKTKSSEKWITKNGIRTINFNSTWVEFYEQCEDKGALPLEFERAQRFIETISSGNIRGFEEFSFAKFIVDNNKAKNKKTPSNRSLNAGV